MRTPAAALAAGLALAVGVAAAAETFPITQSGVGGAKLGVSRAKAKRIFGRPVRLDRLEGGLERLVFPKRDVEVYFRAGADAAVAIDTWSRSFRTPTGIGPCSAVVDLKAAYGPRLVPFWLAGRLIAYRLDRLVFGVSGKRVRSVVLGPGSAAVFIAANSPECGLPGP